MANNCTSKYLKAFIMTLLLNSFLAFAGPTPVSLHFQKGQALLVEWKGQWWKATILDIRQNQYRIHYTDAEKKWDEWLRIDRMAVYCSAPKKKG